MRNCMIVFVIAMATSFALIGCDDQVDTPDGDLDGGADGDGDADADGDSDADGDAEIPEPGLYLRGGVVITATGDPPLENHAVIVRGERIVAVEPVVDDPPPELEVYNFDGMTLLPGLIDAHVHVATQDSDFEVTSAFFINYGVTSVRDLASPLERILEFRDDVAEGNIEGPRISTCGAAFTAPNGHPIATIWPDDPWMVEHTLRTPTDPDQARVEVQLLDEAGVDLIKVVVTACGWDSRVCDRIDVDVLNAIVDEAHALGLQAAVHTDSREDIVDAINAGADTLEHGYTVEGELDDELVALIVDSGVYYVPTMSTVPAYAPTNLNDLVDRVSTLREAGARIAVGTDAGEDMFSATWGVSMRHELMATVMAGFTNMEAIIAATAVNAELMGWSDDLGTIEPGKIADIITVAGDPLEDMNAIFDVRLVVVGGVVVRTGEEE